MTEVYSSNEYLDKHPDWHEADSPWKAEKIVRLLRRNDVHARTVVDVGCGSGRILHELSKTDNDGARFLGFDLSPHAVAMARKYESQNVKFAVGDFLESDCEEPDLLLAIDVVEHVPDYLGFLARLSRRAAMFVFHFPLDMSVLGLLRDSQVYAREVDGHLHYFSKGTCLRTLEDTGFEVLDCEYTKFGVELPARTLKRKLLSILMRLLYACCEGLGVKVLGGASLLVLAKRGEVCNS